MNGAKNESKGVFLPESFVKNVLPGLRADYLKIYIYAKYISKTVNADNKKIAAVLGVDESIIDNAISFFEELGLLKESNGQLNFDLAEDNKDVAPEYNAEEVLDIIAESEELQMLLVSAQKILGRLPSTNSTITLYGIYDWLNMSPELILKLLKYCAELGKKDLRYVEKVAMAWNQMGITNCELADEYIARQNKKSKYSYSIKKIFGIGQRNYTPTEQRYIDSWYELGFSCELIAFAFDYTVNQTGKLALPYMNTVLLAWNENGIKTAEDAKKSVESFKKTKGSKKADGSEKKSKDPKKDYEIYDSGRYDFERIERIARKRLRESLKED